MSIKKEKKDNIIKILVSYLNLNGFKVRKEILKSGAGWRAVSGSCSLNDDKMIFLDKRLGEDDQIEFLVGKIKQFKSNPDSDFLNKLPEYYQGLFHS